jgi:hypothetical protein
MVWSYFGQANETWEEVVFIALAVVNAVAFLFAARFHRKDPSMLSMTLTPIICLMLLYEVIIQALGDSISSDSVAAGFGTVIEAAVSPLFLVTIFEMTYMVHKRRSVKFCGIVFDQGHRINTEPCSWFLRHFVRIVALGLFIWGIVVYFQLGSGTSDPTAGTGGFVDFHGASSQFVLTILPGVIMAAISLYLSVYMWKYGNDASIIVHATICNQWIFVFLGSLAFIIGNIFSSSCCFRVTRAAGQTLLLISVLVTHREVEREMEAAEGFGDFLADENRSAALAGLEKKGVVAAGSTAMLSASWHTRARVGVGEGGAGNLSPVKSDAGTRVRPKSIELGEIPAKLRSASQLAVMDNGEGQDHTAAATRSS